MDSMDAAPQIEGSALSQAELDALTDQLIEKLKTVFDPPWDPSRMSDEAKLQLNMF